MNKEAILGYIVIIGLVVSFCLCITIPVIHSTSCDNHKDPTYTNEVELLTTNGDTIVIYTNGGGQMTHIYYK